MAEKPELDLLRASSERPSWWLRTRSSLSGTWGGRTNITALLALSILLVIAIGVLLSL
jgi:hypothetical protein